MKITETSIKGALIIEPKVFLDNRGFFFESFQQQRYAEYGLTLPFVQDNISRSQKNTLRGLHYQKKQTQGKLVHIIRGEILDVAVDIRRGSPTFGKWTSVILDDKNHRQFYLPPGCAHGFCVLSDEADFIYKCTDYYHPESEITLKWNDPDLNITWPIENPLLSPKDQQGLYLKDIPEEDLPTYEPT